MIEAQTKSKNSIIWQLLLVSLLSLFCEMLVIRWLATEIRLFAYFKNLPLMAAFLGLGLGFLWTNKKVDLFKWSSISLLYFSGLMILSIGLYLTHLSIVDNGKIMFFGNFEHGLGFWKLLSNIGIMTGIFLLATTIFIGLGQRTGQLFEKLSPLQAYSINIAGGLLGIILFAVLSNFLTNPGVWLIVAGILYVLCERSVKHPAPLLLIVLGLTYIFYLAPFITRTAFGPDYITTIWSPYYRIDIRKGRLGVGKENIPVSDDFYINYDSFQSMADSTPALLAKLPEEKRKAFLEFYEKPFRLTGKPLTDVLILGVGSGSDVAAALRCGAQHVDAVEIDNAIYQYGKQNHPEHPYDSPKVTAHIMDARTFLKNCHKKYDVIVYAALDSHTAFSSLSSLRTDNYIFTVQSYREAAKLLKPDGYMAVSFICCPDWLWDRHSKDLYLATKRVPVGYFWVTSLPIGFLICGPKINDTTVLNSDHPRREVKINNSIPETTDDWPFLFLPEHKIPNVYILLLATILLVSTLPLSALLKSGASLVLNWQMFFLGMGFMLLEVRAISAMSLLCGSTWSVNSIVIGGVMVAILGANLIAARLSDRAVIPATLLTLITTIFSSLIDVTNLNSLNWLIGTAIGAVCFLSPLFLAAIIFANLFKRTQSASRALAFNITGGLLGITIEYFSMIYGIKSLAIPALVIYVIVLLLEYWRCRLRPNETTVTNVF